MQNTERRPRPIFGPLVLIAIGLVWLLSSFGVIESPSWGVLFRLWPVALIAGGLELLLRPRWPLISNVIALALVVLATAAVIFARPLGLDTGSQWFSWMPFPWGETAGSGHVITEERAIDEVDRVTFSGIGDLTIQQGAAPALVIEAEDNVIPEIITEQAGRTLTIRYAERNGVARVRPTRNIHLTLTVTDLSQITLSGAGNVQLEALAAGDLEAVLSGAGNLEAAGTAQHLNLVLSGAGSFGGADLQAQTADVTLSGVGNAVVWATERLHATVSGVGWVNYYGDPQVTKDGGGLGTVRSLGDK
jgi:hypothetical protein